MPETGQSAACIPCPPGKYSAFPGQEACTVCKPGTYSEGIGSTICANCSAGGYCPDAGAATHMVRRLCSEGTFGAKIGAVTEAEGCAPCPEGKFNPLRGQAGVGACKPCSPGTRAGLGSSRCQLCAGGTFSNGSTAECTTTTPGYWSIAGSPQPRPCGGVGFFCDQSGLSQPKEVGVGFISTPEDPASEHNRTGQRACPSGSWCAAGIAIPCEVGFYASLLPPEERILPTICMPCPSQSATAARGMAGVTQCKCHAGYVTVTIDGLVRTDGDCACPRGTVLRGGVCKACPTGYTASLGEAECTSCAEVRHGPR